MMDTSGKHLKDEAQHTHDDEMLAAELRDAFGLDAGASGFEVDLTSSNGRGSSARFTGFKRRKRHRQGSRLGDFEILDELGRGGMGIVYRARQISLGREVALKVLPEYGQRGPMAIQRFKIEARAAARLQHTNIVPVYAQGEDNGTFFYAMEFVRGASLDTAIRCRSRLLSPSNVSLAETPRSNPLVRSASETAILQSTDASALELSPGMASSGLGKESPGPTSPGSTSRSRSTSSPGSTAPRAPLPEDARTLLRERRDFCHLARMLSEVATAVQHAHDAGVIHRDLKPQNLLVGPDDRLHITDFGLARLKDEPSLTMPGELMGTPAYLAPEQARADGESIDERTDIYALGVTLYELLTLNRPFRGETREQILTGIKERDPAPPRSFDEHIPNDLQTICLKAMEKQPEDRYESAAAMAEDLRRFADGRPILSRPAGPITRTIKWARRHKALSTAICASFMVLLLASGLAASVIAGRQSLGDKYIARVYDRMIHYDYRANEEQLDALDQAESLGGNPTRIAELRALALLYDGKAKTSRPAALAITQSLIDDADVTPEIRYLHALTLALNGKTNDALAFVEETDDLDGVSPAAWLFRGLTLRFPDPDEAIQSFERAIALRAERGNVFLQASLQLAMARNQQLYKSRTVDDLGAHIRTLERLADSDLYGAYPQNLLSIAHRLAGEVYTGSRGVRATDGVAEYHFDEAVRWAQEGQAIAPNDPLLFIAEAMVLQSRGDFAGAIEVFDAAESTDSAAENRTCETLHYRWRLHYWLGDYDAALADLTRYDNCVHINWAYGFYLFEALVHAERGEFETAIEYAYKMQRVNDEGKHAPLSVVWTATTLRLLGESELADKHLFETDIDMGFLPDKNLRRSHEWVSGLLAMMRGELSYDALIEQARDAAQPWRLAGEAEFHAGVAALAHNNHAQAQEHFLSAWQAYDNQDRYAYFGELLSRKMSQDPAWPAWINPNGT